MDETLVVVTGAGASKDCVAQGDISEFNNEFRPPLTREIFAPRPSFNKILQKYPKVRALSEELRTRLRNNVGLELLLKEMDEIPDLQVKKQVLEIEFYLQELLWTVSDQFILSGGSKYDTLVRNLLTSRYENVIFLTLNYDLFLEMAIEVPDDHAFSNISSYWPKGKKWALVKAHGSVNWGREVLDLHASGITDINAVLGQMSKLPSLSKQMTLLGNRSRIQRFDVNVRVAQNKLLFPCIALPTEGSKDFVCDDQHLEGLKEQLARCTHFLFLGFSGFDPHILDLLREGQRISKVKVVSHSLDSAQAIFKRISERVDRMPRVKGKGDAAYFYGSGFASFVESDDFVSFIRQIEQ